jgi:hypothetical protein
MNPEKIAAVPQRFIYEFGRIRNLRIVNEIAARALMQYPQARLGRSNAGKAFHREFPKRGRRLVGILKFYPHGNRFVAGASCTGEYLEYMSLHKALAQARPNEIERLNFRQNHAHRGRGSLAHTTMADGIDRAVHGPETKFLILIPIGLSAGRIGRTWMVQNPKLIHGAPLWKFSETIRDNRSGAGFKGPPSVEGGDAALLSAASTWSAPAWSIAKPMRFMVLGLLRGR